MRHQRLLALTSLIAAATLTAGAAPVLQPADPVQPTVSSRLAPGDAVTLSFKGGTAGDYIAALRQAIQPRPINVVFKGGAASVQLPPVELASVSVGTAIRTLDRAHEQTPDSGQLRIDRVLEEGGEPVYAIMLYARASQGAAAPMTTDVFSIRGITEPSPDDPEGMPVTLPSSVVLSALEAILNVDGNEGPAPVLKFHPDSGLVVVRAGEGQMVLIKRAIGTMQDDTERRRRTYGTVDPAALNTDLQRGTIHLQGVVDRLSLAQDQYSRIQKQVAAGQAPQQEEIDAAAQVRALERDAETARLAVQTLQKRVDKVRNLRNSTDDKPAK